MDLRNISNKNTMSSNNEKVHFYWLDSLRFIAAFMVLLSHSRNTFFPAFGDLPADQHNIFTMAFTMFCRMGHEAVVIFFVLSGFLVGGRGVERMQNGIMNVGSYAIDRFSRIYPPLLAAIIFYYITSCVIPGTPFSWGTAIGNLLNLQGVACESLVSPFWSLSYEVWFYIVLGASVVLVQADGDKRKLMAFLLFVASLSVFVLGLKMHYLLIWIMGAFAYLYRPKRKSAIILISSLVGFLLTVIYWQLSKDTRSFEFAIEGTNKEFLEVLMSLMACLFIQQVILFEPQRNVTFKIEKIIGSMAKFSYTLYLSHRIVFLWIIAFIWPKDICQYTKEGILIFVVILIITLVSCWGIYLISERYSPLIKKHLKKMLRCQTDSCHL